MSFDLADFSYSRQRVMPKAPIAQLRHFTIEVCGQTIGLPVDNVKTIFRVEKLTPVPLAPREIAGLANLRGRIVTVLHLDLCLWLERRGAQPHSTLAVGVEINGEDYALLIDETGDVVVNAEEDRILCPAHIDARLLELMTACYRRGEGFLSILDLGALLRRLARAGETAALEGAAKNSTIGATQ